MSIRSIFTEPVKLAPPAYRYGILVFVLFWLALEIRWYLIRPPADASDPYRTGIGLLMVLLLHLSSQFRWPKPVTVILRILALSWFVFALVYILYLSRVLYPLPTLPLE